MPKFVIGKRTATEWYQIIEIEAENMDEAKAKSVQIQPSPSDVTHLSTSFEYAEKVR